MKLARDRLKWVLGAFAVVAIAAWLIGAFWIGSRMYAEHNPHRADWKCEKPASVFGTSSWINWPPGRICHYADGTVSRPSETRSVVIIVLVVPAAIGLVFGLLYVRRRPRSRSALLASPCRGRSSSL